MDFIKYFIKRLVRNLLILVALGIGLWVLFPDMMSQIYQFYALLLGPLAILVLVVVALPSPRRRRRRY